MSEIRFHAERFWEVGESVVVAARLTAEGRRTAIPVEQELALVWAIRDGKALRIQAYASLTEALPSRRAGGRMS